MRLSSFLTVFVFALCFIFATFPAHAGQPRLVSKFSDWDTYWFAEGDSKVCYMAGKVKLPEKGKRFGAYAVITHRPGDGTRNVFSFIAGYTYKPGSEATLDIDGQKFLLFTQGDTAWAPDADMDNRIAKAIRSGKSMTVKGTNSAGKVVTDTVSLAGSGGAHDAITKDCY